MSVLLPLCDLINEASGLANDTRHQCDDINRLGRRDFDRMLERFHAARMVGDIAADKGHREACGLQSRGDAIAIVCIEVQYSDVSACLGKALDDCQAKA